jgi:hypothetical protein
LCALLFSQRQNASALSAGVRLSGLAGKVLSSTQQNGLRVSALALSRGNAFAKLFCVHRDALSQDLASLVFAFVKKLYLTSVAATSHRPVALSTNRWRLPVGATVHRVFLHGCAPFLRARIRPLA